MTAPHPTGAEEPSRATAGRHGLPGVVCLGLALVAMAGCPPAAPHPTPRAATRAATRARPASAPRPPATCRPDRRVVKAVPPLVVEGERVEYREQRDGEVWTVGELSVAAGLLLTVDPAADMPYRRRCYFEVHRGTRVVYETVVDDEHCGINGGRRAGEPCASHEEPEERRREPLLRVGRDLTGTGRAHAVLWWHAGGQLPTYADVYVLEPAVRKLGSFVHPEFRDLDGDGALEVLEPDGPSYAFGLRMHQPLPRVVHRFKTGAYRVADDLMRKPAPSDAELQGFASALSAALPGCDTPPKEWEGAGLHPLVSRMARLIYSGQGRVADRLLDLAWKWTPACKRSFRAALLRLLSGSTRYWKDIERMNGGAI